MSELPKKFLNNRIKSYARSRERCLECKETDLPDNLFSLIEDLEGMMWAALNDLREEMRAKQQESDLL